MSPMSTIVPPQRAADQLIRQVLVIGASLAGLGAARALQNHGYHVTVLEARDRLGGRCHTVDLIDLGAHWIHGTEGNPITNLARELDADTTFTGGDSSYTGGWERLLFHTPVATPLSAEAKMRGILAADTLWEDLDDL